MYVTQHAKTRIKERCGINKSATDRLAQIAYEKGIKHCELTGQLRKYVDSLYLKYEIGNNIKLYGDKTYIFAGSRLITVLQTPQKYINGVKKISKRKNENVL